MVSCSRPHYLLFSEAEPAAGGRRGRREAIGGRWRFQLEPVEGGGGFGASDEEPGLSAARLELLAVVRGLEALDHPAQITLVTPSRYVSRGIRFGLTHWREQGWQWEHYGRMRTVTNGDLWRRVDTALTIHQVRCRWWRFDQPEVAAEAPSPHGSRCRASTVTGAGQVEGFWRKVRSSVRSWRSPRPALSAQPPFLSLCAQ